ncbi:hypothetical protein Nans01_11290 [Nocardiopsis ansamitocini]|uniref:Uncharacterized protein n=1 Tax=Nocardiopsis ansamitocini TaxID=1670832 RepID=A0A9W6P4C0_9ACTN|nr:hypothetical protein Nans01_11290 [Nocardiopsis ansamitocini]
MPGGGSQVCGVTGRATGGGGQAHMAASPPRPGGGAVGHAQGWEGGEASDRSLCWGSEGQGDPGGGGTFPIVGRHY